jgi:hypothetical protein
MTEPKFRIQQSDRTKLWYVIRISNDEIIDERETREGARELKRRMDSNAVVRENTKSRRCQ